MGSDASESAAFCLPLRCAVYVKGMPKSSLGSVTEFLQTLVSCGGEADRMGSAQPSNSALAKVLDTDEQQTLLQAPASQDLPQPDQNAASTLANSQLGTCLRHVSGCHSVSLEKCSGALPRNSCVHIDVKALHLWNYCQTHLLVPGSLLA